MGMALQEWPGPALSMDTLGNCLGWGIFKRTIFLISWEAEILLKKCHSIFRTIDESIMNF